MMKKRPPDGLYRYDPDTNRYERRDSFEPRFHLQPEDIAARLNVEWPPRKSLLKRVIDWLSPSDPLDRPNEANHE